MTKPTMRIKKPVIDRIHKWARDADRDECMGLLAAPPTGDPFLITSACLLPAEATGSHAVADPVAIKRAVVKMASRVLIPLGMWHSHGFHEVFHSATDDGTAERLLPALAESAFRRPRPPWSVPVATGPDSALLPLPDGQALSFVLLGPPVPDVDGYEPAVWSQIVTTFRKPRKVPRAFQEGAQLHLEAGMTRLSLGVPSGASVLSGRKDIAIVRTATLFSLVVNARGDGYAETMIVREVDGQSWLDRKSCAIEVLEDASSLLAVRNSRWVRAHEWNGIQAINGGGKGWS